jgi:hypothetical protein
MQEEAGNQPALVPEDQQEAMPFAAAMADPFEDLGCVQLFRRWRQLRWWSVTLM